MANSRDEVLETLRDAREHVAYFRELGIETIDPAGAPAVATPLPAATAAAPKQVENIRPLMQPVPAKTSLQVEPHGDVPTRDQSSLFGNVVAPAPAFASTSETLEGIWGDIGDCTRCGLCEGRTQVVNTHGNPKARLMFIGEAPGADEDAQGKPFVGRAGQLLTKIIEAIGMKREEVIIGNVNRCRPPGNRQPTLEEAAICRPFLFREIAAVQPEVIVVMGNTAMRNLLETREGITRLRGQFQDFRGIKVMPTFHPAYLLRDPSKKRETWEDIKKVRTYLDQHAGS